MSKMKYKFFCLWVLLYPTCLSGELPDSGSRCKVVSRVKLDSVTGGIGDSTAVSGEELSHAVTSLQNESCDQPLLGNAKIYATSSLGNRLGPEKARLDGDGAWTAKSSDLNQYLTIDLGAIHKVTAIAIQGRPSTSEFVREFRLEYGDKMLDYVEYKDHGGHTLIFSGNNDGNSVKTNTLNSPIIAQWIKILPTKWHDRISMQVELYGCNYEHESLSFSGDSFVKKKLLHPIISEYSTIQFRFRTNHGDGVIIHSQGKQGDFISLQLMSNHLVLNINLGGDGIGSSISAGSLLDDDRWHDVTIILQRKDVTLSVDRVAVSSKVRGDFFTLNLEREVFLGGVPHFNQDGIGVISNFIGCIENLSFNEINFISELKAGKEEYDTFGNVGFTCEHEQITAITFISSTSHLQLSGPRQHIMDCSFDFRTFDDGLLFHHKFFEQGYIKLLLEDGKMKIDLLAKHTPKIVAEISDLYLNDGQWHRTALILEENRIKVNIDGISSVTTRQFSMITSQEYVFGGGPFPLRSFIGCMRNIHIDGHYVNLSSLSKDQYHEVILGTCQLTDRCIPNPCEHGGICTQNQEEFKCNCENTGYNGAVCHTSHNVISCEAYRSINPSPGNVDIKIDIDGSGPLDPFPVTCIIPLEGPSMTILHHDSEKPSDVVGFSEPGSFIRNIIYDTDMDQIIQLLNHSHKCKQRLRYDCYNSRLLNSSAKDASTFSPFSWWVSRSNQPMDYWGGSLPGSKKCACGLHGSCRNPEKSCNCDSEDDLWLFDEGDLTQMEYLPVSKLRFGDTGSGVREKKGRFTVGPLICEGDTLFDHVITQYSEDATLEFSSFDMGYSGDIYFQFKSTASNFVLFSYRGPNEFIEFVVTGGDQIHVRLGSSDGSVHTSPMTHKLNDDNWHSLYVERNTKELCLIIDTKYMLQITMRHVVQALNHTPKLIIGASADYRDGFIGCIRALMLNGVSVNLQQSSHYGINTGCVTKCQSNPCLNNGSCIEGYSHYECDCQLTAFKGRLCADEIGVKLLSNSYVLYNFKTTVSTLEEYIRVGFTTSHRNGMILGISSYSKEYLNLMISSNGYLQLVFDFGFGRKEIIIRNTNFASGQFHDIRIKRSDNGSKMTIHVDDYEPVIYTFEIDENVDAQFNELQSIYVGRNESMRLEEGFIGCISRVQFNNNFPLRNLWADNVVVFPSSLKEDNCGIEPVMHPSEINA